MLELIVLGQIPGTQIYINFSGIIIAFVLIVLAAIALKTLRVNNRMPQIIRADLTHLLVIARK